MNELVQHFRAKNPQSNLTDEEITLRYANRYDVNQLKEQYPGWWGDYKSYLDEVDPISIGERVGGAVKSVKAGFAGGLAEIPEFLGIAANQASNVVRGRKDVPDNIFMDAGKAIRDTAPGPEDPRLQDDFLLGKVAQGVGSAGSFVASTVGTMGVGALAQGGVKLAGKAAAAAAMKNIAQKEVRAGFIKSTVGDIARTATIGSMMTAPSGFRDAMTNTGDIDQAYQSFWLNALGGATEAAGIGQSLARFTTKLDKASGGGLKSMLMKDVLPESLEEAAQEIIQGQWADTVARNIVKYDPERKFLFENLAEDAAVGGITGALVSSVVSVLNRRANIIEQTEGNKLRQEVAEEVEQAQQTQVDDSASAASDSDQTAEATAPQESTGPAPGAESLSDTIVRDLAADPSLQTANPNVFSPIEADQKLQDPDSLSDTARNLAKQLKDRFGLEDAEISSVEFPIEQIEIDQKLVPQFKAKADEETGEVESNKLSAKEYVRPANPIIVWQLKNGRNVVITGRHRLALAKRLGEKTIPTAIVKEADGFTREHALVLDAEYNIRDEKGDVEDFAHYFENVPITETQASQRGLFDGAKGRNGWALGRLAIEDLKALYRADKIKQDTAILIARKAPENEAAQRFGMKMALKGEKPQDIDASMQAMLDTVDSIGLPQPEQASLPGFEIDDSIETMFQRMGAIKNRMLGEVRDQINTIAGAAKRPDKAKALGVDIKDPFSLQQKKDELRALEARLTGQYLNDSEIGPKVKAEYQRIYGEAYDPFKPQAEPEPKQEDEIPDEDAPKPDTGTMDMFGEDEEISQPEPSPEPSTEEPEQEGNQSFDKASEILGLFGVTIKDLGDGNASLEGKTYDLREELKKFGARWNPDAKLWTIPISNLDGVTERFQEMLQDSGYSTEDLNRIRRPYIPEYVTDPRYAKLRQEQDAVPDNSALPKPIKSYVPDKTRKSLEDGKKFGIPANVINDQIEDTARIVRAYEEKLPVFLLASQPGSGKTFVLGASIESLKAKGAKSITYVTMNSVLVDQIKSDLAGYDIEGVNIITYPQLRKSKAEETDVLIFDEGHAVKNVDGSTQGKAASEWINKSKLTVFSSATPFEDPLQTRYMSATGVFKEFKNRWDDFIYTFGAKSIEQGGGNVTPVYRRGPSSPRDLKAAHDFFRKRGMFTSRKITLPEGMVDVKMQKVKAQRSIVKAYADLEKVISGLDKEPGFWKTDDGQVITVNQWSVPWLINFQKRLLESSKIEAGVKEAEAALKAGRFPILFVETKSERVIDIDDLSQRNNEYLQEKQINRRVNRKNYNLPPEGIVELFELYRAETGESVITIPPAEQVIQEHFGNDKVAIFTGSVRDPQARKNLQDWRSKKKPILVATMAKGGTGLSLHDKTGDHPTTQINVNLPWTATQVTQVTQRSARYGLKSKAEIKWLFTDDIPFDRKLAGKVGGRMADMGAIVGGDLRVSDAEKLESFSLEDEGFGKEPAIIEEPAGTEANTEPVTQPGQEKPAQQETEAPKETKKPESSSSSDEQTQQAQTDDSASDPEPEVSTFANAWEEAIAANSDKYAATLRKQVNGLRQQVLEIQEKIESSGNQAQQRQFTKIMDGLVTGIANRNQIIEDIENGDISWYNAIAFGEYFGRTDFKGKKETRDRDLEDATKPERQIPAFIDLTNDTIVSRFPQAKLLQQSWKAGDIATVGDILFPTSASVSGNQANTSSRTFVVLRLPESGRVVVASGGKKNIKLTKAEQAEAGKTVEYAPAVTLSKEIQKEFTSSTRTHTKLSTLFNGQVELIGAFQTILPVPNMEFVYPSKESFDSTIGLDAAEQVLITKELGTARGNVSLNQQTSSENEIIDNIPATEAPISKEAELVELKYEFAETAWEAISNGEPVDVILQRPNFRKYLFEKSPWFRNQITAEEIQSLPQAQRQAKLQSIMQQIEKTIHHVAQNSNEEDFPHLLEYTFKADPSMGIQNALIYAKSIYKVHKEKGIIKYRNIPDSARVSTKDLKARFNNTLRMALNRGFDIAVAEGQVEKAAWIKGANGQRMIRMTINDIFNPSKENFTSLVHEIGHDVFDSIPKTDRDMLIAAMQDISAEDIGIAGYDALIDGSLPEAVRDIEQREELLVEAASRILVTRGMGRKKAIPLVGKFVALLKDLYFSVLNALHKNRTGKDDPRMAARWLAMRIEGAITGNPVVNYANFTAGPIQTFMDRAKAYRPMNGGSLSNMEIDEAGYVSARKVIATDLDSALLNIDIDAAAFDPSNILKYRNTGFKGQLSESRREFMEMLQVIASNNYVTEKLLRPVFQEIQKKTSERLDYDSVMSEVFGVPRHELPHAQNRRLLSSERFFNLPDQAKANLTQAAGNPDAISMLDPNIYGPQAKKQIYGVTKTLLNRAYGNGVRFIQQAESILNQIKDIEDRLDEFAQQRVSQQAITVKSALKVAQGYIKQWEQLSKLGHNGIRVAASNSKLAFYYKQTYGGNLPNGFYKSVANLRQAAKGDQLTEALAGIGDLMNNQNIDLNSVSLQDLILEVEANFGRDPRLSLFKDKVATAMVFAAIRTRPEIGNILKLRRMQGVDHRLVDKMLKLTVSADPANLKEAAAILERFPTQAVQEIENMEQEIKALQQQKKNLSADLANKTAASEFLENTTVTDRIHRQMAKDLNIQLWVKQSGDPDPKKLKALINTLGGEANWELTDYSPVPLFINDKATAAEVLKIDIVQWQDVRKNPSSVIELENAMTRWLDKNEPGGDVYALLKKMRDEIRIYRTIEINKGVKRNMWLARMGSVRDKVGNIDMPQARQLKQALGKYQSLLEVESGARAIEAIATPWVKAGEAARSALGLTHVEVIENVAWPALYYIAERTDLAVETAKREALLFVARHMPIKNSTDNPLKIVRDNEKAIMEWIDAYAEAAGGLDRIREKMGVKIEDEVDVIVDGQKTKSRFGRDSIGSSWQRVPRYGSAGIRHLVQETLYKRLGMPLGAWEDTYGAGLFGDDLQSILERRDWNDPEVVSKFIRPLLENEVRNPLLKGLPDFDFSTKVYEIFQRNEGDLGSALEEIALLPELEQVVENENGAQETVPMDPVDILKIIHETYNAVYNAVNQDNDPTRVQAKDEVRHVAMDARVTDGWPLEWIEFARYDSQSVQQNISVLAIHSAFGRDMIKWSKQVDNLKTQLRTIAGSHKEQKDKIGIEATKAAIKAEFGDKWRKEWEFRQQAQSMVTDLVSVDNDMMQFVNDTLGVPLEQQYFQEVVSGMAGMTVQGLGSLITESGSYSLMPILRMGLIGGGRMMRALGSNAFKRIVNNFASAMGKQLVFDMEVQKMWAESGRGDAANLNSYRDRLRGIDWDRKVLDRDPGFMKESLRLVRKSKKLLLDTGFRGKSSSETDSIKIQSPMTMMNEVMKFSMFQSFYNRFDHIVRSMAEYFDGMSQREIESFVLKADIFKDKNHPLYRLFGNEQETQFYLDAIVDYGIDLKTMTVEYMKRRMEKPDSQTLTNEDMALIGTVIDSEFTLDGNMLTRSPFFLTNNVGKAMAPLFAWAWSMTNVISKRVTPESWDWQDVKTMMRVSTLPIAATMPFAIFLSYMRDWYDEEALGKRNSVPDVLNTDNPLAAFTERIARTGIFGMAGDVAVNVFSPDPSLKMLSLGTDVYVLNMINAPIDLAKEVYNAKGNVTYSSMGRRMLQTFGLSGYLQNFQVVNNILGLDNEEARFNRRVHTGNVIRLAAKANDLPIRAFSGGFSSPTPWKAYVKGMIQSAMVGDYVGFREAHEKAVRAARESGKADPENSIRLSFQANHPLKIYFKESITNQDYLKMLRSMTDDQREDILDAISNINRFGQRIGVDPYTGKQVERRRRASLSTIGY